MTKRMYLFSLLLFLFKSASGQEESSVQFLSFQPSPLLAGAGQIGATIPITDATGFYYNPAQLGYFSRVNNLSVYFMPKITSWMPDYKVDLSYNSTAASVGYNFRNSKNKLPFSIGVGYIHYKLDDGDFFGKSLDTPYQFGIISYDDFDCLSIGAGYDYYLQFNLGFSIKSFSSRLSVYPSYIEMGVGKTDGTAFDLGAMITAPVSKLFFNNLTYNISKTTYIKPKFDFTVGYSLTNMGKEVYYLDKSTTHPLPRTARLGYTFNFGIESITTNFSQSIIDYSFTAEAEDLLFMRNPDTIVYRGYDYQNALGDIKFGKHLIELNGDQDVVVHKGHIFRFLGTLTIASGRYNGRAYNNRKSNSIGLSSEGLFKFLTVLTDNPIICFIANHFVWDYYNTNILVDSYSETNIKGLVINFRL